jgi:tRNA nucleotidyltransferase/poly(A) polymerase
MFHLDSTARGRLADRIVRRLRAHGHEALLAGGCVRDHLLNLEPQDYDVATSARPEQVRRIFGRRHTVAVGAAFGVITVVGSQAEGQVDVATFRSDSPYSNGRHPDGVTFSSAERDAQRRDFTINGMFWDPIRGEIIDYVGGRRDLERRLLRAIGDPDSRIAEDKLRMLRGVRFAGTFGFQLESSTLSAIRRHRHEITVVSAERIANEMQRMLIHENRYRAAELLRQSGLLEVLLPELPGPGGQPEAAGAVESEPAWRVTLAVLEELRHASFPVALAGLLSQAGNRAKRPEIAEQIGHRWKLSNHDRRRTTWLVRHEATARQADALPWSQLQPLLVDDGGRELVQLAAAVARARGESLAGIALCRDCLRWPPEQLDPPPLVDGHDLIRAGLSPGPQFAVLLRSLRAAQLDGQLSSPGAAIEYARRFLASPGAAAD